MRLRILTAVWGAAYVERFLRFALRSLMAPGNLPDLARQHDVTYEIYAPAEDIERIERDPTFAELSRMVEIHFHPFPLSKIDAENAMSHWEVWSWGVASARKEDVYVVLIAPDQVFCRGTLQRWADLLQHGSLAVFCTGFQVVMETLTDDVASRFRAGEPIDLSLAELRELTFRHLHPIMISMFRGSPRWIMHPEWHLRAVRGHGLVQRILASHAYAFHPGRIKLTKNFCPLEKFDRVAFEPSCFLGAEPLLKQLGLYLRPRRMDDTTLSYCGIWAETFMSDANLRESQISHVIPLGNSMSQPAQRRQQLGGDFYVAQMKASRGLVRLWRVLHEAGLYQAARWVAAAHLHGRIRRRLPVEGPMTLFVPADDVLDRLAAGEVLRLLKDNGTELAAAMRAHLAPARHALAPGDRLAEMDDGAISTSDGRRYSRSSDGSITVLRGPIRVDDAEIYVVDGVLAPLSLQPRIGANRLRRARHRLEHSRRRLMRRGRAVLLALLQRDRRLLGLMLKLRERWTSIGQTRSDGQVATAAPAALALYRRALALRGLEAMRDTYEFYARDVLDGSEVASAPRAYLSDFGGAPNGSDDLIRAVETAPYFSEAWLELGYLRQEMGDVAGAIEAFGRAQASPPALPHLMGQPDVRAVAATERARLLERTGRLDEALAGLDATPVKRYAPWNFHLCRARLLLDLGRAQEALSEFEQCLQWRGVEPRLVALLPRHPSDIRHALQG